MFDAYSKAGHPTADKWLPLEFRQGMKTDTIHNCPKKGQNGNCRRHSEAAREKMKVKRAKQVLPIKDTKIEVAIQDGLINLGISFTKHEPIIGQPDIFVKPNLCVFADGIQV